MCLCWRVDQVTSADTPDLEVRPDELAINRLVYRYFSPDDCNLEELAVEEPGWRRLLQFEGTVYNVGGRPLHVGAVTSEDPEHNAFVYSPCHDHFHYSNYGDFFIEGETVITGAKQAFCLQSTDRFANNETTPLTHGYSCSFQGIETGWVDEYIAGLEAQWVDITHLDVPQDGQEYTLGFRSNGQQFLCEGTPVLDENGELLWEPTGETGEDGVEIERPQCDFIEDWDANNVATLPVFVPQVGSFVTQPCANDEIGPRRNCDFSEWAPDEEAQLCTTGESVSLTVEDIEQPLVIRGCERSAALGTGMACTWSNALFNITASDTSEEIDFTCPAMRDGDQEEGGYAIYTAPLYSFGS